MRFLRRRCSAFFSLPTFVTLVAVFEWLCAGISFFGVFVSVSFCNWIPKLRLIAKVQRIEQKLPLCIWKDQTVSNSNRFYGFGVTTSSHSIDINYWKRKFELALSCTPKRYKTLNTNTNTETNNHSQKNKINET